MTNHKFIASDFSGKNCEKVKIHCKWDKKRKVWKAIYSNEEKKDPDFLKCPLCQARGLKFNGSFDLTAKKAMITKITCETCHQIIEFDNLNEKSRMFLMNAYLSDLSSILSELYPMRKVYRHDIGDLTGKEQFSEIKGKLTFDSKYVKLKCGHCNKKNKFIILKEKEGIFFQCMRCGRINSADFINLTSHPNPN